MERTYKTPEYQRKAYKAYFDRNKNNPEFQEKLRETAKKNYEKNKEKIKGKARDYYHANKEKILARQKEKYQAKKEELNSIPEE
tara:strand:+ start:2794 stop:3045 length:252 start_codon:yes stop_codon:yes gene_type:complete